MENKFKEVVLSWIDENLNPPMEIIPIAQDPFGTECKPILDLKLEWLIQEPE